MRLILCLPVAACLTFSGQYFRGEATESQGIDYLGLLDRARRMLSPADVELQTVTGVYDANNFALAEGAQWSGNFWTQNSYGFGLASVGFLPDPLLRWLHTSYLWWYDHIGDGAQTLAGLADVPAGLLCDNGNPSGCNYMQCGPGRGSKLVPRQSVSKRQQTIERYKRSLGDTEALGHDFIIEGTLAGSIMQAEMLLATRNISGAQSLLSKMKQTSDFLETRRVQDSSSLTPGAAGLFFAGNGANLLAPAFGGQGIPIGCLFNSSCGQANFPPCCAQRGFSYLTGLTVTYSGLLDRMIHLENMAFPEGRQCSKPNSGTANISSCVDVYTQRRKANDLSLSAVMAFMEFSQSRYLIKSLSPDGERHGVYADRAPCALDRPCAPQTRHGYFETSPNADAIALNIVNESLKKEFYASMQAVQGLRPCAWTLPNFPDYDDACGQCIWGYGYWVSGGHWATLEGRVILAHYDQRRFDLASGAMARLLNPYAALFKLDSPVAHQGCGPGTYSQQVPGPILDVDIFAIPAAFIKGIFGYEYRADTLVLHPRLPPNVSSITQVFPVRWGNVQLFFTLTGAANQTLVSSVSLNGTMCTSCIVKGGEFVSLAWELFLSGGPTAIHVALGAPLLNQLDEISLRGDLALRQWQVLELSRQTVVSPKNGLCVLNATVQDWIVNITSFLQAMETVGLSSRFEAAQAQAFLVAVNVSLTRCEGRQNGTIPNMPMQPKEWSLYNMSYDQNATEAYFPDLYGRLFRGLCNAIASYDRVNASPTERIVLTQFWSPAGSYVRSDWAIMDGIETQILELRNVLSALEQKRAEL